MFRVNRCCTTYVALIYTKGIPGELFLPVPSFQYNLSLKIESNICHSTEKVYKFIRLKFKVQLNICHET